MSDIVILRRMVATQRPSRTASPAAALAGFATTLDWVDLPAEVVERTKLHVLDVLGCGLAAHALAIAGEGRATMAELGSGGASVLGLAARLPSANAAFANAMLCHGLDYDDTHSDSVCHISTVVVPAALALAEERGLDGRRLLAAIAAGSETVARIGMSASGRFHARGFHPTSACGVFGAAAAAAALGGLSEQEALRALGIAGSMSSGLLAFLNDGSQTKPIHAAWAAHGGLLAAALASHGAQGPASVLDGRFGLYDAFTGDAASDIDVQVSDLGERWETLRIAAKPFPACHYMHGSLGATASLLGQVRAEEIAEVVVTVPEGAVPIVCEPVAEKCPPRSDYDAKFSIQYSTAALLVHGRVTLATYTPAGRADREVADLARLVRHEVRDYATAEAGFPGGVRITTRGGVTLEADFPYQLGAPENPLGEPALRAKFRDNAGAALDAGALATVEESVATLEEPGALDRLGAALRSARGAAA